MKIEKKIYAAYIIVLIILVGLVVATPLIAFQNEESAEPLYSAFSYTCHQKLSRSLCLFQDEKGLFIDDCTPQTGIFITSDNSIISSEINGTRGYKLPVCSRCIALYFAMLLGGIIYPFVKKIEEKKIPPAIYFMIAIAPIALDGVVQLIAALGIIPVYESTNLIRIITGGLAGFAASVYLIPILMNLFGED